MTPPVFQIDSLQRRYGNLVAVDDLSFAIGPGEILGLVGPNGAGKTTTLRTLAGIDRPSGGRVRIGGHDLLGDARKAKRITGYVPDDPRLFDALTVEEHLYLTASLYGMSADESVLTSLLHDFELTEKRDTAVDSLSLGMRQKVAICCAYLIEPVALVFDEPLTGLDPRGIRTITRSIRERAEAGAAIIVSSHLLGLVESLCTQVLVLDRGRCVLHDTMANVLNRISDAHDGTLESLFLEITGNDAANG